MFIFQVKKYFKMFPLHESSKKKKITHSSFQGPLIERSDGPRQGPGTRPQGKGQGLHAAKFTNGLKTDYGSCRLNSYVLVTSAHEGNIK